MLHLMNTNKEPQLQTYAIGFFRNLSRVNSLKQLLIDMGVFDALVEIVQDADDDIFDDKVMQSALSNAVATIGSFASLYHVLSSVDGIPDEQVQYAEELVEEMGVEKGANQALCELLQKVISASNNATNQIMLELPQFTFQALQFLSLVTANAKQLYAMKIGKLVEQLLSNSRFRDNHNVQKQGSTLIQVITMNEELVEDLSKSNSDGEDDLDKLMNEFRTGNPSRQCYALGIMWNLANVQTNLDVMKDRGVLDLALEALKTAKYQEYMVNASGLLAALAFNRHNATLLGVKGVIPLLNGLLSAIKDAPSTPENDSILENVLACFGCLSLVQSNREEMGLYNLLKKFVSMLQEKNLKPAFKNLLIKIMISLAHEERHKMFENGGVEVFIDLLNDETNPLQLRSDVCAVLWNLQNDDVIQSFLHERNVFDTMVSLLSETDLNKTSDLLNQDMAGLESEELLVRANRELQDFDMAKYEEEMKHLKRLDEEMNIDHSDDEMDDDDDDDSEYEETDMSLTPEDLETEGEELHPEDDDEEEEELKPIEDEAVAEEADLELEPEHDHTIDDDLKELQPEEMPVVENDKHIRAKKERNDEAERLRKQKVYIMIILLLCYSQ